MLFSLSYSSTTNKLITASDEWTLEGGHFGPNLNKVSKNTYPAFHLAVSSLLNTHRAGDHDYHKRECPYCVDIRRPLPENISSLGTQAELWDAVDMQNHEAHKSLKPRGFTHAPHLWQPTDGMHYATNIILGIRSSGAESGNRRRRTLWHVLTLYDFNEAQFREHIVKKQTENLEFTMLETSSIQEEVHLRIQTQQVQPILGGCYAQIQQDRAIQVGIYQIIPITAHKTTALSHDGDEFKKNITLQKVHLKYVETIETSYANASTALLEHVRDYNGLYICVMCPLILRGVIIGGSIEADSDYQMSELSLNDEYQYMPTPIGMKKVSITHIAEPQIKRAAEVVSAALAKQAQWQSTTPTTFPIIPHGIDLRATLYGTDEMARITEQKSIGQTLTTLQVKRGLVQWATRPSTTTRELALAPAFAGLTAMWLDRNIVQTLTQAANWLGGSRSTEIEPIVRSSMRRLARTQLELTRYYVRLWAMYYDAASATASNSTYDPQPIDYGRQQCEIVDTYNAWAARVANTHGIVYNPIYFDVSGMGCIDDLLPVLLASVSSGLRDSPLAQWIWPDIHGAMLLTNSPVKVRIEGIDHHQILSTINWLISATDTLSQAQSARSLIMCLAMRSEGDGIIGRRARSMAFTIKLPAAQTSPLLLLPFSLWTTTAAPSDEPPINSIHPRDFLTTTAMTSQLYHYTTTAAFMRSAGPSWWPKLCQKQLATQTRTLRAYYPHGWGPAIQGLQMAALMAPNVDTAGALHVLPRDNKTAMLLSEHEPPNGDDLLSWCQQLPDTDPAAARVAVINIVSQPNDVVIGTPIRIETLATSLQPELLVHKLRRAGIAIGLAFKNRILNNITNIRWAPQEKSINRAHVPYRPIGFDIIPVIKLNSHEQYFHLLHSIHMSKKTTWYISQATNMDWSNEEPPYDTNRGISDNEPRHNVRNEREETAKQKRPQSPASSKSDASDSDNEMNSAMAGVSSPPAAFTTIAQPDIVMHTMMRCVAGDKVFKARALEQLPTWKFPASIADDDHALEWLLIALPAVYSGLNDQAAEHALNRITLSIVEQLRLNQLRGYELDEAQCEELERRNKELEASGSDNEGKSTTHSRGSASQEQTRTKKSLPSSPTSVSHQLGIQDAGLPHLTQSNIGIQNTPQQGKRSNKQRAQSADALATLTLDISS